MVNNVFILAGGSGTRLFPASTPDFPKQFLPLKSGKSLLLETLERAAALNPDGRILIITIKDHLHLVIKEVLKMKEGRDKVLVLPEPEARNTAPALALAGLWAIKDGRGAETSLVAPADHLIEPVTLFAERVEDADSLAKKEFLVTFGIKPDRPETGYGYIEAGDSLETGMKVKRFREKPDQETAESFLRQGGFFWNSGMFCWKSDVFIQELALHHPQVTDALGRISTFEIEAVEQVQVVKQTEQIGAAYADSPSISVDFAVMEKSSCTAVVPSAFSWDDLGSWDEYAAHLGDGDPVTQIDAENVFALSDMPVAVCGVSDIMVVQKNGRLLICKKGDGQLVKEAANRMLSGD